MYKNSRLELLNLINENPDLQIVFMVNNDEIDLEYGRSAFEDFDCNVSEIYVLDEEVYDDEKYVIEKYSDNLCDKDEYKNMTDEEFKKAIREYVDKNVEHYKAIVVNVG